MKKNLLSIALLVSSLTFGVTAQAYVPRDTGYIGIAADISPDYAPHDNQSSLVRSGSEAGLPTLNLMAGGVWFSQTRTWQGWEVNLFNQRAVNYHIEGSNNTQFHTWGWRVFATGAYNVVGNLNIEGAVGSAVVEQEVSHNSMTSLRPTWRVGLTYFTNDHLKIGIYNTYTYGQQLTQGDPLTSHATYMMNDVSLAIHYYL